MYFRRRFLFHPFLNENLFTFGPQKSPIFSPDCDDTAQREWHIPDLRDEERGDGLIKGGAVHVDGGADGHHEARHPGVDSVFLLERRHRNRKGRRAAYQNKFAHPDFEKKKCKPGGGTEGGRERLRHVGDELEGQGPGEADVDDGQHDEAVEENSDHHREVVHAQLAGDHVKVVHLHDLGGDQKHHTHGREPAKSMR